MEQPPWAAVLSAGIEVNGVIGPATIEHREIGRIRLPSGRLIAADVMVEPTFPPFSRTVTPGLYPVRLAIAHFADGDQRVAASWVAFQEGDVARWSGAGLGTDPELTATLDDAGAYPVDSATGGFLSPEAAALIADKLDDGLADELREGAESNYVPTREWSMVELPGSDGLNLALFSTGLGDGTYASYWGDDGEGRPVVLLTDFGLLDTDAAVREPGRKPWWKVW
jgi:hypothetical protein